MRERLQVGTETRSTLQILTSFQALCRLIKHLASKDPNRKGCSIVLYLVVCLGVVGVAAVARAGGLVGGAALGLAVTQPPPRRSCSP